MKTKLIVLAVCCFCSVQLSLAQSNDNIYRRNSLCTYFISDIDLLVSQDGVVDEIRRYLDNYVVSDKFDDHTIGSRYVSVKNVSFSDADRAMVDEKFAKSLNKEEKKESKFSKFLNAMLPTVPEDESQKAKQLEADMANFLSQHSEIFSARTAEEYEENTMIESAKIYRYLVNAKFANQLVAKWFNAKNEKIDGSHYDMSVIQERGLYNASELDVMKAAETTRKWAILQDAGMELIPHTFVSFTHFEIIDGRKYQERSHASEAGELANKISGKLFNRSDKEMEESNRRIEAETAGYYITSTTYLYQLVWTDDLLEKFINEYWEADLSKLENSDDFTLKYLGYERNTVKTIENVKGKGFFRGLRTTLKEGISDSFEKVYMGASETEVDAKRLATHEKTRKEKTLKMTEQSLIRSIDATYMALQKAHEEFKVKAPLIDVEEDAITAYIGLKEGVTANSEFEVLERTYNEKKGVFGYKKAGKLKVDKKRIWDNRYTLIDEGTNIVREGNKAVIIDRTYFKGSTGGIAPGMLIRQIK